MEFTGYAFADHIDNGREGLKLGLFRAQSNKVAKRLVRRRVEQPNGSFRANGDVVRRKGNLCLVHSAVTDDKIGDSPTFSFTIFPEVARLVGPGRYEGFKVIIQGVNAGPHHDTKIS